MFVREEQGTTSFETLGTIYPESHRNIPEDLNIFFRQLRVFYLLTFLFIQSKYMGHSPKDIEHVKNSYNVYKRQNIYSA